MVTVLDTATREKLKDRVLRLERRGINVLSGKQSLDDSTQYQRAIISPGIPRSAPLVENLLKRRIEMIGEVELAYEMCHCPVVAVTGTNGKTTTTGLIHSLLAGSGKSVAAGGNMGPPFSSLVGNSSELDYLVVEVSSFQLEEIRQFRPTVAVWLNFSPDHLDRYASLAEYRAAKLRIFMNQQHGDFAIVNRACELPELRAERITFSAFRGDADFTMPVEGVISFRGCEVFRMRDSQLSGIHNVENLMAALATGYALGVRFDDMQAGLGSYQAERHRNELVDEINGIRFINDSKSTNPASLEMALRSQQRPVVLIAGGKEKGFSFSGLSELIKSKVKAAVLIGEISGNLAQEWQDLTSCRQARSLDEAVTMASQLAQPGDVVLLSPGTSSFDMFSGYEERGCQFCEAVLSHKLTK